MPNTIKRVKYMHDDIGLEASLRRTNKKRWCLFQATSLPGQDAKPQMAGFGQEPPCKVQPTKPQAEPLILDAVCPWAHNCAQKNTIV